MADSDLDTLSSPLLIKGDDDDFVNKPSAKTGLLKYAQKGVSNTKDVKARPAVCRAVAA